MIYAESPDARSKIVCFNLSEFLPYRDKGYLSTPENNAKADARLAELRATSDEVLAYLAPMIRTGEDYRFEHWRRLQANK